MRNRLIVTGVITLIGFFLGSRSNRPVVKNGGSVEARDRPPDLERPPRPQGTQEARQEARQGRPQPPLTAPPPEEHHTAQHRETGERNTSGPRS